MEHLDHLPPWKDFIARNNLAVAEFFVTAAGCFRSRGRLSEVDRDTFRQLIQQEQRLPSPLSISDNVAQSHFFQMLELWYGEERIVDNLFRYSVQPDLMTLKKAVADLGTALLARIPLYLNRRLPSSHGSTSDSLATYIMTIAESVVGALSDLADIEEHLAYLVPSLALLDGDPEALDLENTLATSCGFDGVHFGTYKAKGGALEHSHQATRWLADAVDQCILSIGGLASHPYLDPVRSTQFQLQLSLDAVHGYCAKLKALSEPGQGYFTHYEARRLLSQFALVEIATALQPVPKIVESLLDGLTRRSSFPLEAHLQDPRTEKRLAHHLVQKQHLGPKEAKRASFGLINYCLSKSVPPNQLIEAEAKKIHAALDQTTLNRLDRLVSPVMVEGADQKTATLKRVTQLSESIKRLATNAARVILISLIVISSNLVSGCGVKTAPISELDDLRPSLPFKERVAAPPPPPPTETETTTQLGTDSLEPAPPQPEPVTPQAITPKDPPEGTQWNNISPTVPNVFETEQSDKQEEDNGQD